MPRNVDVILCWGLDKPATRRARRQNAGPTSESGGYCFYFDLCAFVQTRSLRRINCSSRGGSVIVCATRLRATIPAK